MAISTAMCTSFKVQLFMGYHDFTVTGGDVFKLALYTSSATLDATTTQYSASNEVGASGSYAAGGGALTNVEPTSSSTTAFVDFADLTFTTATITARGCLIYNSTTNNAAVSTHDFGSDKSSSSGNFTLQFPTPDASNAILRLA